MVTSSVPAADRRRRRAGVAHRPELRLGQGPADAADGDQTAGAAAAAPVPIATGRDVPPDEETTGLPPEPLPKDVDALLEESNGTLVQPVVALVIPRPKTNRSPVLRTVDHLITLLPPSSSLPGLGSAARCLLSKPRAIPRSLRIRTAHPPSPMNGTPWSARSGTPWRERPARNTSAVTSSRTNPDRGREEWACPSPLVPAGV